MVGARVADLIMEAAVAVGLNSAEDLAKFAVVIQHIQISVKEAAKAAWDGNL
jgi:hypothetical protein